MLITHHGKAAAWHIERMPGQHRSLVGLRHQFGERAHDLSKLLEPEQRQAEVRPQLDEVFSPLSESPARLRQASTARPARPV